jgi:hypothetical protein
MRAEFAKCPPSRRSAELAGSAVPLNYLDSID